MKKKFITNFSTLLSGFLLFGMFFMASSSALAQNYVGPQEAVIRIKAEVEAVDQQINGGTVARMASTSAQLTKTDYFVAEFGRVLSEEIVAGVSIATALDKAQNHLLGSQIPAPVASELRNRFHNLLKI
jgi:hypothetical protein